MASNAVIVFMVVSVVLAVLGFAFASLYCLNKTVDERAGAVAGVVGIRCGAISGNMKVSFQAARSIG